MIGPLVIDDSKISISLRWTAIRVHYSICGLCSEAFLYINYLCIECICIINALIRVHSADTIYISFINECVCTALLCTCALCKVQRAGICVCCGYSRCIYHKKKMHTLHADESTSWHSQRESVFVLCITPLWYSVRCMYYICIMYM